MATTVDDLIVRIQADTKSLETALGRVKRQTAGAFTPTILDRFKNGLKGLAGPAKLAGAAIATIGAVRVAKVGAEFESLKLSLQSVFGSAEAGQDAFNRITQFAQESPFQVKDLTKAFIQLKSAGIEPTQEMLTTFADASSVAVDSLGAFEAMVRITQRSTGGGLGLEELTQISDRGIPVFEILAEKLGRSRDQITEMGQSAEGAKVIMDALSRGMQERFGGTVALKMESLNQKLSNMTDSFDTLASTLFEGGLGSGFKTLVDEITNGVRELDIFFKMLDTGMSREFVTAGSIGEQIKIAEAARKALDAEGGGGTTRTAQGEGRDKVRLDNLIESLKERQKESNRLNAANAEELRLQQENTKAALAQTAAEKEAADAREDAISDLQSLLNSLKTPAQQIGEQMAMINAELALIADGSGSQFTTEQLNAALETLDDQLEEVNEKAKEVAVTLGEELTQAVISNVNAFTTDFVNALMNGASALDSFKNLAKNLVSQIISIFLQMMVVNKILNAVFGLTGSAALPTGSIGGSGASTGTGVGFFGFGASGGAMSRGRPYMVGERGPELFIPHTAGTLRNAADSRSSGGSGIVINQNINLSTGVAATVRTEVTKMLPTISEVTKASVLEAAGRGGKYRRGLMGA